MGKTYRYNPDEEPERGGSDASAEVRRKRKGGKRRGSQPQQEQPPEIVDLSWAVERMQEHVSFVVDSLVKKQLIVEDEREEYLAIFTAEVCQAGTDYDPNRKGAKSGKTSSPLHYMTMRVDAKLSNTMDYLAYRRWALKFLSITDDEDEAEGDEGAFVQQRQVPERRMPWREAARVPDGRRDVDLDAHRGGAYDAGDAVRGLHGHRDRGGADAGVPPCDGPPPRAESPCRTHTGKGQEMRLLPAQRGKGARKNLKKLFRFSPPSSE